MIEFLAPHALGEVGATRDEVRRRVALLLAVPDADPGVSGS
jgi:hypothetical protein